MRWRTKAGDEVAARLGEPLTKDLTAQALAHRARRQGRVDPGRAGRRGPPADGGTPRRPRRRWPGHRHRPDPGPGLRQDPRDDLRREARSWCSPTTPARRARSRPSPRATSAGWWPCGWCPRGSTCPGSRRRLRHLDLDAAVLRPGRRPVRPGPAPRRDRVGVPAQRPADPRARRAAGGRARPRARPAEVGQPRGLDVGPRGRAARRGQPHRVHRRHRPDVVRGPGVRGAVRPRPVRRRAVRPRRRPGLRARRRTSSACPACSSRTRCATLLRERQSAQQGSGRARKADEQVSAHRALAATRKELNALVSAYARKNGAPHAVVHTDLRRHCGGPPWTRPAPSRSPSGSRPSAAGSSAAAEPSRPRDPAPAGATGHSTGEGHPSAVAWRRDQHRRHPCPRPAPGSRGRDLPDAGPRPGGPAAAGLARARRRAHRHRAGRPAGESAGRSSTGWWRPWRPATSSPVARTAGSGSAWPSPGCPHRCCRCCARGPCPPCAPWPTRSAPPRT